MSAEAPVAGTVYFAGWDIPEHRVAAEAYLKEKGWTNAQVKYAPLKVPGDINMILIVGK